MLPNGNQEEVERVLANVAKERQAARRSRRDLPYSNSRLERIKRDRATTQEKLGFNPRTRMGRDREQHKCCALKIVLCDLREP